MTAPPVHHRQDLLSPNVAHVSWVFSAMDKLSGVHCEEVVGMEAQDYVASVLEQICDRTPPEGIFYLVRRMARWRPWVAFEAFHRRSRG